MPFSVPRVSRAPHPAPGPTHPRQRQQDDTSHASSVSSSTATPTARPQAQQPGGEPSHSSSSGRTEASSVRASGRHKARASLARGAGSENELTTTTVATPLSAVQPLVGANAPVTNDAVTAITLLLAEAHRVTTQQVSNLGRMFQDQAQAIAARLAAKETRSAEPSVRSERPTEGEEVESHASRRIPQPLPALGMPAPPAVPASSMPPPTAEPGRRRIEPTLVGQQQIPPWLTELMRRPELLEPHILLYLQELTMLCDGTRIRGLTPLSDAFVRDELDLLATTRGTRRFYPSLPVAMCQNAFFAANMTIEASELVTGEHGTFPRPGMSLPETTFLYMGEAWEYPTQRKGSLCSLNLTDGPATYVVEGKVAAYGPNGEQLQNWLAKMNEYLHDHKSNTFRFTERGHALMMFKYANKNIMEVCEAWKEHYAGVLDTVEDLCASGAPSLLVYQRICAGEMEAETLVEAEIALWLTAVEGHYDVCQYYPQLARTGHSHNVELILGTPTASMIPHVLLCMPGVLSEIQFRVADNPDLPRPDNYHAEWAEQWSDWLVTAVINRRVDVSHTANTAVLATLDRAMPSFTISRDDHSMTSTLPTVQSGPGSRGPIRSPSLASRPATTASAAAARALTVARAKCVDGPPLAPEATAPAQNPEAAPVTGLVGLRAPGVYWKDAIAGARTGTWDGRLGHQFPRSLPVDDQLLHERTCIPKRRAQHGHFQMMKKITISDTDMEALRRCKGGYMAPQRTISWWRRIWRRVGTCSEPTKTNGICCVENVLEDKLLEPDDVVKAVQYLQDLILLYLVTFRHASAPTSRVEVQRAIENEHLSDPHIGGTYALYKRILHLHEQLTPSEPPKYATAKDSVLDAMRRSGTDTRHGMALAKHLEAEIRDYNTNRVAEGGSARPDPTVQFQVLEAACQNLAEEHKTTILHMMRVATSEAPHSRYGAEAVVGVTTTQPETLPTLAPQLPRRSSFSRSRSPSQRPGDRTTPVTGDAGSNVSTPAASPAAVQRVYGVDPNVERFTADCRDSRQTVPQHSRG
ncbi:hypothetical protein B484DRAFT_429744 [Ochromonadaceae sp. CCMP2298]|nr:hypothetical protein B484DRAFT_429744 [Ochromonadaceae sp. CCMP2298]